MRSYHAVFTMYMYLKLTEHKATAATNLHQLLPRPLKAEHCLVVHRRGPNIVDVPHDLEHPLPHSGSHHRRPADLGLGERW